MKKLTMTIGNAFRLVPLAIFSLLALQGAVALADEYESGWEEGWTCGTRIGLSESLVDRIQFDYLSPARDKLPDFMAGRIRGVAAGSILFTRIDGDWNALAVQEVASFFNVYAAHRQGGAVLFSMTSVEGPGQEYTVISTGDSFASLRCGTLSPPDVELGTTDYMQIVDFNADAAGKGRLVGFIAYGDGREDQWFEAVTPDGGGSWAVPTPIPGRPDKIKGVFQEITVTEGLDMISDLQASFPVGLPQ